MNQNRADGAFSPSRPPSAGAGAEAAGHFSALDLRDRVVIMLLFNEVVRIEQVALAWARQQELRERGKDEALWRVLAAHPGVDREQVYAAAAEAYAFDRVELAPESVVGYLKRVKESYTDRQWEAMRRLNVLPVAQKDQLGYSEKVQVTFATHDPVRPEVQRMMEGLRLERVELRYAPESLLRSLLEEAFSDQGGRLGQRTRPSTARDVEASGQDADVRPGPSPAEIVAARNALTDLFDAALADAARLGATDVQVRLGADAAEVHFEIGGVLRRWSGTDGVRPETLRAAFAKA